MSYLNRINGYAPTGRVNSEPPEFPVVTICGSMRFYPLMLKEAERLTAQGCIVLLPFVTKGAAVDAAMLDKMHRVKMDMADRIVFVIGRYFYMGESTTAEWDYASSKNMNVATVTG